MLSLLFAFALVHSTCPFTVGVGTNGALYSDRLHQWSMTKLEMVDSVIQTGCFCADDCPKPITSVKLVIAANAPSQEVDRVLSTLAHDGWPRTKIQIEVWKAYPARPL
jgi:hypothetical protein